MEKGEAAKVIPINGVKSEAKYRFVKDMKCEVVQLKNGVKRNENMPVIMLEQEKDGLVRRKIHPLTEYLLKRKKKGGKYSAITQNNKATLIVKFLNYVLIDNAEKFKLKDFPDILFEHGTEFLNSLTGVNNETLDRYANQLARFYYFLAENNLLKNITVDDFSVDVVQTARGKVEVIENPFYGMEYNNNETPVLIHKLPLSLVVYFVDTAIMYAPRIALGICFQFFGGLRLGEIINLKRSSMKVKGPSGEFGFVLNLKDTHMRDDLRHPVAGGSVKKKRRQAVFPFGGKIFQKVYEMHMKQNICKTDDNALFVNADGNPMADFTYRYYFEKVKAKFLERLRNSDIIELKHYAIELESVKWSTHIGRGIFSNIISSISKNILEIAQARGDGTLDAALSYLSDSDKMAIMLLDNDAEMWKYLEEATNEIMGEK